MSNQKIKNRGMYFFVFLLFFSILSFKFIPNLNNSIVDVNNKVFGKSPLEECSTCQGVIEEQVDQEENNYEVYYIDESQTIEISRNSVNGEVLGFSVDCSNLDAVNTLDSIKKLCSSTSGDIDHGNYSSIIGSDGGGVKVGKDTSFELVVVTYPLAFWLGQYVFEDSNREAKETSPEYSSNGQQIDIDYQKKTLSPQEASIFESEVSGTVREDFKVTGNLVVEGADEVNSNPPGEYIVSNTTNEPKCLCTEEVSTSDYNVGMANYIGSNSENGGYFRQQIPGGDKYKEDEGEECLEEGKDYDTLTSGNVLACIDVGGVIKALFDGFFSKVFGVEQWEACTVGREECYFDEELNEEVCTTVKEECLDTKNIGVKMTPIFGDPYECTDELCANAFLTYSYKGSLSPEQSSTKKVSADNNDDSLMFFVGTPCQAKVDTNGKGNLVPVTCLWDASPLLLDYKLQAKDKAPNQENFPEKFEDYWDDVKVAIGKSAEYYGL